MGMLMHHTWLEQQKKNPAEPKREEKPVETKAEAEPVKKPVGRRKSSK